MASIEDRPIEDGARMQRATSCAHYNVHTDGAVPLIAVAGEIDVSNADTLARCLSAFEPGDAVILDLSRLTFLDSTGLGVLAHTHARGIKLIGRGAQGPVRRVLEISGMDGVVLTHED